MTVISSQELSLFANSHSGFVPSPEVPIDTCFPEEETDALAKAESFNKHLYRPNSYLHKWWARRSGTTFRHILKQLIPDVDKRDYYKPGGLEGAVILDPMMGGGTTIHEAVRLGASCVGVDVDPIPVLQVKATLARTTLAEKASVFGAFMDTLKTRVSPFFVTKCPICSSQSESTFTLYALRRKCSCGEVAVLDSLVLRHQRPQSVRICPFCRAVFVGDAHSCSQSHNQSLLVPLVERGRAVCASCGQAYHDITDIPFRDRYTPIAIAGRCKEHGEFFKSVESDDIAVLAEAITAASNSNYFDPRGFNVPNGRKSDDLLSRHVTSYLDLFTMRQLIYLGESAKLIEEMQPTHQLWVALLVSTSLEFNSILCGYKGADLKRPGAIRHVFSHHAYSFPYTAVENNPVSSHASSGTLLRLYHDRIVRASRWASRPIERRVVDGRQVQIAIEGETDSASIISSADELRAGDKRAFIAQRDSRSLFLAQRSVDHVVTDPPYYDSVQYSDLSTFFRVWLSHFSPNEANWGYDPADSAVAGDDRDAMAYGESLTAIWKNCNNALRRPHGRLVFTFHHWNPRAWAELTLSLRRARFGLVNRFAIHSENPISVHIRDLRALTYDCILVLRPIDDKPQDAHRWSLPDTVSSNDSRSFCLSCGDALGCLLESSISEDAVREAWQNLLGE